MAPEPLLRMSEDLALEDLIKIPGDRAFPTRQGHVMNDRFFDVDLIMSGGRPETVHGKTARLYVTTPTGSWSPSASLTSLAEWESLGKRESNFAPAPKKRRMQVSPKFAAAEAAWAARKAEAVQ